MNALGLAAGLAVAVVMLVLARLASSGRLNRWSDRRTCTVLGAGAAVIAVCAVVLWVSMPIGWRWA